MITWKDIEPELRNKFNKKLYLSNGKEFHKYVRRAVSQRNVMLQSSLEYKTPQYILDEDLLLKRAGLIKEAFARHFKKSRIFYAFKCNDLPYAIRLLKDAGINADVSGMLELKLALKLGFSRIIFTAPVKTDDELKLAIKNDVIINIDNLDELERVVELSKRPGRVKSLVSFRVDTGKGRWSKFGMPFSDLVKSIDIAARAKDVRWTGLHFHSSWNSTPGHYTSGIKKISEFIGKQVPAVQRQHLRFLDIGGGFLSEGSASLISDTDRGSLIEIAGRDPGHKICLEKVAGIDEFASAISKVVKNSIFAGLELWAEPGRYISQMPTSILLRVVSAGKRITVDGGINLIGSADFKYLYFPIVNLSRPSLEMKEQVIYGSLCDPDDLWGYYYFGEKCRKGDILAVMHTGAYTFSTAWRFIRPIAPYTAFSGNRLVLARKGEMFSDRYRNCLVTKD